MVRTGLYVVALAVAIIGLIWLVFREAASVPVSYEQEAAPLDRTPANSVAAGPTPNQKNPAGPTHLSTELAPADVMGNSDCLMKPGASKTRDLAIIVVSGQDGSRFAVVDRSGVVFGDSLPFPATVKPSFARREDGSVLAGFGGIDIHGAEITDRRIGPAMQGVVVYQDGQIIFESLEAAGFGLADDGSSYYVLEPMAGNATRLVVRNLDLGVEVHHDLGILQPHPDTNAYAVGYSLDQSEVIVGTPDTSSVPRTHFADAMFIASHDHLEFSFLPADGGEPRKLTDYRGFPTFVSSNEAYFAFPRGLGYATVKREYTYEGGDVSTVEERWSRDLRPGPVAADGAWLVAVDYNVSRVRETTEAHVLDPSTGDTLLVRRWSPYVDQWPRIHDGRLALGHSVYDGGSYRTVYDVYDVRTLVDGGPPNHYQVESGVGPQVSAHCGSGANPFGKLEVRDDQLIYVPRK